VKELILAAKAFSDPARVRILMALRGGELCVCELCDALSATQSTLSTHLQVIRKAGLVTARRQGKWMYYTIAPQAQPVIRSLFQHYAGSLDRDTTLRRDAKTLAKRLALRTEGSCCIGFGKTKCGY
jgi:ArsR family transcriptional regulator